MKHDYPDILELTDKKPLWYDMDGVPRFRPFDPYLCPDVYVKEVVLLKIRCHYCGREFSVEMHYRPYGKSIREAIEDGDFGCLHYSDPPSHVYEVDKCIGNTMNCEGVRIMEFWQLEGSEWTRKPECEIELPEEVWA